MKAISKKDLQCIGFVRKAGGFKGEVILVIETGVPEDFEAVGFFFLEIEGKPVPFAVEVIEFKRGDLIVKLEDINDEPASKALATKKVFIEKNTLAEDEEELQWTSLVGYTAIDGSAGKLGVIEKVEEYPQQWIAKCTLNGKEVLFPLNDDSITNIDDESKTVHLNLPEGLIDLYLG